jgi:GrpB-like predicted nucleotidyltransferase (UPF0157 family)
MITFIKGLFSKKTPTSLSVFMKDAPVEERERLLSDVVRRSNADQRNLVERLNPQQKVGVSN